MRPQSAKAKGRRLQQKVASDILEAFPHLTPDDCFSTSMGAHGEDVRMSPATRQCVPLSIECKCQERLNVFAALQQAETNCPSAATPCLVFTKNRTKTYAVVPWDTLLSLYVLVRNLTNEGGSMKTDDPSGDSPGNQPANPSDPPKETVVLPSRVMSLINDLAKYSSIEM